MSFEAASSIQEHQTLPKNTEHHSKDPEELSEEFLCTPYEFSNQSGKEVDYNKLIEQFGTKSIDRDLLEEFERISGERLHVLLRRDLPLFLKAAKEKKPIFLYTGRGPSSEAMHLGHLLPFVFTSYLQRVFKCPLVIQLTDDEKFFLQKPDEKKDIEYFRELAYKNARDIIACGFDKERTFIFSDLDYIGHMYPNICKGIFGLKDSDNVGRSAFPAIQAVPSFSNSFPHIFGSNKKVLCLIPQGIDQDPYFRMTRDIAERMGMMKPCCIHSMFLPGLHGFGTKMSSSDPTTAIFLTDTASQIKNKINKYAFSGGQQSEQLQREKGADIGVDISYNYLKYFLEDDHQLLDIGDKYKAGELLTSEVKNILINELQKVVQKHQENRQKITEEEVKEYMTPRPLRFFDESSIPLETLGNN